MDKSSKKPKGLAKDARRKVAIKDLKAKNAGSVKGGLTSSLAFPKLTADKDIKLNITNTTIKW
jgi:hypothetical protein